MLRRPLLRAGLVLLSIAALLVLMMAPIAAAAPPSNDSFGTPTAITFPEPPPSSFSTTQDTTEATTDASDPPFFCYGASRATVWYSLAPAQSMAIDANTFGSNYNAVITVVTGTPGAFNPVACGGQSVQFVATAGQTYYLMIGESSPYPAPGGGGSLALAVNSNPLPPLQASFYFYPSAPSAFDTIQFYDNSYDPAGAGIASQLWDFGDGATATGGYPTHQYAAVGDYTVQFAISSVDGRTASISQIVHVANHDVAIAKFAAPNSGRANQTAKLSVGVASKLAAEMVQVDLYKSAPGTFDGFQLIGSQRLLAPARSSNKLVTVNFNYTFTSDDASLGKVTFKAVVSPVDLHDVFPGDNEARATTKVTR
jgi:PKD domain